MRSAQQKYVHGYNDFEINRLNDQARTLDSILHHDTYFPSGNKVIEIGCGVGAQTEILCRNNPEIRLTSVDISDESLQRASERCSASGYKNVRFIQADVYDLPFKDESFDHIFICFVLEHLPDAGLALEKLKSFLRPGGSIMIIEGDHGSAYFYPQSKYAQKTIDCLIELQARDGGNSLIGRSLYPLLEMKGFHDIQVSPRVIYADTSIPELVDGFTLKTFTAMVEGVREKAIRSKLIMEQDWDKGINDLRMTAQPDGVFCYTFFKAKAIL
jgi:SAM-dependent methyltransferase